MQSFLSCLLLHQVPCPNIWITLCAYPVPMTILLSYMLIQRSFPTERQDDAIILSGDLPRISSIGIENDCITRTNIGLVVLLFYFGY